jgi:fructose-bisphosphate aldolase, class II
VPLVASTELFKEAMAGRFAVGAFNANSFEHIQAIVETAQEERAPVVVAFVESAIRYFGLRLVAEIVKTAADMVDVPVVLHLDHGPDFERNAQCIRAGFTSVMFDGSRLPFDENVRVTREIVAMAHACGIAVEVELGTMFSSGDDVSADQVREGMTDPQEAKHFLVLTGADSLAIAAGSIHGMKGQGATLDLQLIEEIRDVTHAPLVLHGSSGVTNDSLVGAIERGVVKINVGTYISQGFVAGLRKGMQASPDNVDPRNWLTVSRDVMKERVREKMRLFKSSGRITASGGVVSGRSVCSGFTGPELDE